MDVTETHTPRSTTAPPPSPASACEVVGDAAWRSAELGGNFCECAAHLGRGATGTRRGVAGRGAEQGLEAQHRG